MSEFRRQHPVASITRVIDLIRGNLVTILVVLVFGAGGGGPSFLWMFSGLFVFLLIAGVAGWWRFLYRVEEGELQIHQGILVRRQLHLTSDRIQVIDISAGVVQRLFGLVKVEIKTAGSTSREAVLGAVSRMEAEELTRLLRRENGVQDHSGSGSAVQPLESFRLPVRDLLIAASTSGSFGIALSLIATLFSQIEPMLDETELYEWFLAALPGEADLLFVLSLMALFVIFAWLVSFFGTLLRFGDFRLDLYENELVIRRGIFEKKRITLPFNRIQAVRIVEGVFRQPFGYATIYLESAGYGEQKESGAVVLFPLLKISRIDSFLERTLPAYRYPEPHIRPPLRALYRYVIRSCAALVPLVAVLQWLLDAPPAIWALTVVGILWGWIRYRDAGVSTDGEKIVMRSRLLARTTGVVEKRRAQEMSWRESLLQRRRELASLAVSVASGDQGRRFQVSDLESAAARSLLPWIRKRSQTAAGS